MANLPPLTPEEQKLSYSKYYYEPMAPVPPEKLKILADGPIDPAKALDVRDRSKLFDPGYLETEIGYCVMPDGTGFLANLTPMPGVTAEMFDWWMAWHSLEDLRYKIWDPEDHVYARVLDSDRAHVLDKSLPMRQRTWGVTHDVLEDIGGGADTLIIEFKRPADMGYPEEKVGTPACATMATGNGHSPQPGPNAIAAVMTHFIREIDGGIELRSRFWIGYQIDENRQPVKVVPDGVIIPEIAPRGLFAHNLKEFSNLAALLPKIYPEEKDNW